MKLFIENGALQQCPVCRRFKTIDGDYITISQMSVIEFEKYKNYEDRLNKTGISEMVCLVCDSQRVVRLRVEVQILKNEGKLFIDYVLE